MKPAIIQHTEYKRMLRARLNAYFPDKSEIQKEIAPLYRKFRDLDLSAVDRIMQSHYSNFGPIPWSPSNLLRAMLVMVSYKCVTFTRWVTELRVSPILAIICGFDPEHIPGIGTFYDFMTRLWDLPTDNFTSHIKKPQAKKPKKPKGKGQKAESIESESVAQLIARLSQTQFCIDNEAYCTLYKIFRTCFLDQSISFGLLNPEKLRLAGDGTPVVTAARARSHHVCDCIKKAFSIASVPAISLNLTAMSVGIHPVMPGISAMICTFSPTQRTICLYFPSFTKHPNTIPIVSAKPSSATTPFRRT